NYKVFEYLAIQYVMYYTSWINGRTMHKDICFLRPYEYICIDTGTSDAEVRSVKFIINNRKETNLDKLSNRLESILKSVIENPGFKEQRVALTLTGGYDSRLITAIAEKYYKKAVCRISVSDESHSSLQDAVIASKVAERIKRTLIKLTLPGEAEEKFRLYSEGMSPAANIVITSAYEDAGSYPIGFGGCYGTELFKSKPYYSEIGDFVKARITGARAFLKADEEMWQQLQLAIEEQFESIREHYILSEKNTCDIIQLLFILTTGSFSSFLLAPFNINGLQVEPYGYFKIIELVLQLPPEFKPPALLIGGGFLQKEVMAKVNPGLGKITTTHKRPMLPVSFKTFPIYMWNYFWDKYRIYSYHIRKRFKVSEAEPDFESIIENISCIPNGSETYFKEKVNRYLNL
ncbi:MAG: hypothetical protein GY757_11250, partial [bacterium]|nr:hypothetical protein [bacterium]